MTGEASSATQVWRARGCRQAQHRPVQGTASAVSGDNAEAAERVCDEPDKPASGVHALRGGDGVGFGVGE
jgi:hypothetical protein